VVKLIDKYFGKIPPSEKPVPKVTTTEPTQFGERRIEVEYDAEPRMLIGWKMLAGGDVDQEVFDIISSILSRGRTSRLYKSLVVDKKMVSSIYASSAFTRIPDTFTISASPKKGHSIAEVEEAIYEEIEKLKNEGPTEWELQRVHNQLEANFVRGLRSNNGLAYRLTNMQAKTGDWSYLLTLKEKRKAVTAEDIQRVIGEYFIDNYKTVAYNVKPESVTDGADQSALTAPETKEAVAK